MPEYLAPGVYVEEISFQPNAIGGVSTSITGFIGPTSFGPAYGVPDLLTSFSDYQNIYGSLDPLHFDDAPEMPNYLAQAVRAFFQNGGQQLYVVRTFSSVARGTEETDPGHTYDPDPAAEFSQQTAGLASVSIEDLSSSPSTQSIPIYARYPGQYGNVSVTFTVSVGQNVLSGVPHDPSNPLGAKDPVLRGVNDKDTVWIAQSPNPPYGGALYWADNFLNPVTKQWDWRFWDESNSVRHLSDLTPVTGSTGNVVRVITVTVEVEFPGAFPRTVTYPNLTFHPDAPTSLSQFFAQAPSSRSAALTEPLMFDPEKSMSSGPAIARILMTQLRSASETGRLKKILSGPVTSPPVPLPNFSILGTLGYPQLANTDRQFQVVLSGGSDGFWPTPRYYEGDDSNPKAKTGLIAFEDLTDISIVAAPGSTAKNLKLNPTDLDTADKLTIAGLLIAHCEKMRYRVAVLDSMNDQDLTEVSDYRGQLDSEYAALYYPWVTIVDPVTQNEINAPPSGFVAGLYVKNDIITGVHKAPANMVVDLAIGFEAMLNKSQQDVLNPIGINCFRFFEGRGYRLWGARTISSNSEWQYVNIRRYFCYLEHSIDIGTQWVVFEPNSEALWGRVVTSVSDFLYSEFKAGHLMGTKPEQAYFVRCDRSTMTENDIQNGRLICLVGVAPIYPAEFVIFRIGQWAGSQVA